MFVTAWRDDVAGELAIVTLMCASTAYMTTTRTVFQGRKKCSQGLNSMSRIKEQRALKQGRTTFVTADD